MNCNQAYSNAHDLDRQAVMVAFSYGARVNIIPVDKNSTLSVRRSTELSTVMVVGRPGADRSLMFGATMPRITSHVFGESLY